jgi:hypothetical protein
LAVKVVRGAAVPLPIKKDNWAAHQFLEAARATQLLRPRVLLAELMVAGRQGAELALLVRRALLVLF